MEGVGCLDTSGGVAVMCYACYDLRLGCTWVIGPVLGVSMIMQDRNNFVLMSLFDSVF